MIERFTFTIDAERQYRRVYQGTQYTLTWVSANGLTHTAKSRNFNKLQRFVTNGFKLEGLPRYHGITVIN